MAASYSVNTASTYKKIATYTVSGSSTASYTFSNLPQNFTDLVLVANWGQNSGTVRELALRFNGDTGTNYSVTELYGNGTSAVSYRRNNYAYLDIAINNPAVTNWNVNTVNIQNYSNSTTYKTVLSRHSSAASEAEASVSLWRSTAAITSMQLVFEGAVNFLSGSTFTLYGIEAATAPKATGGVFWFIPTFSVINCSCTGNCRWWWRRVSNKPSNRRWRCRRI